MHLRQLKKIFGLAFVFALVLGMASAERTGAHEFDDHGMAECSSTAEGVDTIMVTVDTPLNPPAANEFTHEADAEAGHLRPRTIQELVGCLGPGDTLQFADGEYEDVGVLTINKSGTADDTETADTDETALITIRGNVGAPMVEFTGEVQLSVIAKNIVLEGLTFKGTEADGDDEDDVPSGEHTLHITTFGDQDGVSPMGCVATNIAVRNSRFENTAGNGIYVEGNRETDCVPNGIEISRNTFMNIGYNRDWIDGMGPGDLGTGIPEAGSLTGSPSTAIRLRYSGTETTHNGFANVTIADNSIDGTTYAGIMVQGVVGDGDGNDATTGAIEVSRNSVSNVPGFGIRIQEWPISGDDGRVYGLTVNKNRVTNANSSVWAVRSYGQYKTVAGFAAAASDLLRDRLLKPEIWRTSEGTTKKIFDETGAPVSIFDNFRGFTADGTPTQADGSAAGGRDAEYRVVGDDFHGDRVMPDDSPIPHVFGGDRADSCPTGTDPCFSVVRFLDPRAEGAIELDAVTTESVTITENELTDNTLGLVICGGENCNFNDPYGAVNNTLPFTATQTAFAGAREGTDVVFDISMNNIYGNRASEEEDDDAPGESAIGVDELVNLPRGFAIGDVYVAIGDLEEKVDLGGNYLGANPVLITGRRAESLERDPGSYDLADERFDLDTGPSAGPEAPELASAGVNGAALTLTYSEALDEDSVPATGDFTVTVNDGARDVSEVAVQGRAVTLTLASAIEFGDSVSLSYTPGDNPITDVNDDLPAAALTDEEVTNNTPDPTSPGEDDDDGCALASSGGSGMDLGMLLALATVPFGFFWGRRAREVR